MYAIMLFGSDVLRDVGRVRLCALLANGGEPQSSKFWRRPKLLYEHIPNS